MSQETEVPAEVINTLTEEILSALEKTRKLMMYKDKDKDDEFVYRVVATFGALSLMLQKHIQYMLNNGYSAENIKKLEENFRDSFTWIEDIPPVETQELKN